MKNLIEIHVLQNFAPSNLNRDDTGAPKDALFGGTRRARISSQCFKRAVRQYFGSMVQQGGLADHNVGVRTKKILGLLTDALAGLGRPVEESREKVVQALAAQKLTVSDDDKSQYLIFIGKQEIQSIARIIDEKWDALVINGENDGGEKKKGKSKKDAAKQSDPELKKALEKVFNGGKSVDIALFGRMLTDMPENNQYAACQVAHSISTHSVEREFDFYTAVDDLKPDDNSGADMIGTMEFNSACFYRYSAIDFSKLLENLQGDRELALNGLSAFLEAFVVAAPSGKQNSFAAHNPAEFVAVTIRQNGAPRNLANAFEKAIRTKSGESLSSRSAQELVKKAQVLQTAFGGEDETFVLNLVGADVSGFGIPVTSLKQLLDETIASIKG